MTGRPETSQSARVILVPNSRVAHGGFHVGFGNVMRRLPVNTLIAKPSGSSHLPPGVKDMDAADACSLWTLNTMCTFDARHMHFAPRFLTCMRPSCLTLSLPQSVKFPGWKMHGHACKQYIFCSCNIYFQCCVSRWKSFHMAVWKIRQNS